ncbi:2OG-Fe(II) oxygenase superfamily protein [Xylogone sp. PMI_703]|nr:2OG-Fe(II) oxygenase superfamily protein [Xylogone sp. PMI_703]
MPSAVAPAPPPLPLWKRPPKTSVALPWADIAVIDLSTYDHPGGKEELARQLKYAVETTGFFSVIGTGFTHDEVERQYSIGQAFFKEPIEEKKKASCDFSVGNYFGYRPYNEKRIKGTDVLDNVESVNIPKFIPELAHEPRHDFFKPYLPEIEDFSRRSLEIASKIFTLFALILELPEDYFSSRHAYASKSEDHLRYMLYHPRTAQQDSLVDNSWSRAHTDFGSLTLLWSQNIAGLQIKTPQGDWRYIPPVDGGIICNVGDAMQFWSAGYLKSTIHRVVRPPRDQDSVERLGLFYFVRPGDEVDIAPAPSPLLRRLGLIKEEQLRQGEGRTKVTGLQYVRERVKDYHDHQNYDDRKGKTFKVGDLEIEDEAA